MVVNLYGPGWLIFHTMARERSGSRRGPSPGREKTLEFAPTLERLRKALESPLPGAEAHLRLSVGRRPGWVPGEVPDEAKPAGVLILLYPRDGEAYLPLTVRTHAVETHRGQVSLPGGALDPGEEPEAGALREAEEEVGVPADRVGVLGKLSPLYVPVSGFAIQPVVGSMEARPEFRPAPAEVAEVVEVPLARLAALGSVRREWVTRRDARRQLIAFFPVSGQRVWGATAMILAELLHVLGARPWEASESRGLDVRGEPE
jgi:8-oxo-dGTP pyrophosphatase MutT (NUDIX family)